MHGARAYMIPLVVSQHGLAFCFDVRQSMLRLNWQNSVIGGAVAYIVGAIIAVFISQLVAAEFFAVLPEIAQRDRRRIDGLATVLDFLPFPRRGGAIRVYSTPASRAKQIPR